MGPVHHHAAFVYHCHATLWICYSSFVGLRMRHRCACAQSRTVYPRFSRSPQASMWLIISLFVCSIWFVVKLFFGIEDYHGLSWSGWECISTESATASLIFTPHCSNHAFTVPREVQTQPQLSRPRRMHDRVCPLLWEALLGQVLQRSPNFSELVYLENLPSVSSRDSLRSFSRILRVHGTILVEHSSFVGVIF